MITASDAWKCSPPPPSMPGLVSWRWATSQIQKPTLPLDARKVELEDELQRPFCGDG
jgi:hypothetical protein